MHDKDAEATKDHLPDVAPPPTYAASSSSEQPGFGNPFACVSMNMTDRIRFLRFPPAHTAHMREVIRQRWPRGIQDTRNYDESYEIKLSGYPWKAPGINWGGAEGDRVQARRLVCKVLGGLFDLGWVLKAGVHVNQNESDRGRSPVILSPFINDLFPFCRVSYHLLQACRY